MLDQEKTQHNHKTSIILHRKLSGMNILKSVTDAAIVLKIAVV